MVKAEQQMQGNKTLQFWLFEENKMPKPFTDQIHVLLVVPKQDDRGDFLLDDIADDKSVLTIVDPRLPFAMSGIADVLLINRTSKNRLIRLAGVSLVIELKKKVELGHIPQAIGQLVSCSMKAPLNCYPLSLLTDLNDRWHFSWFSDNHILTQVTLTYPKNAFRFIKAVLRRTESAPLPPSFIPEPFKIIKVDDFLLQPDDGYAEEMMERYEWMADVVEPAFLMARRAEYAQHLVQSMPMYAHIILNCVELIVMKEDQEDIWRDSLVRYFGYANEVGESFRPIAPRLVVPSYAVAFGYVLGDTFDKATKTHKEAVAQNVPSRKRNVLVATATVDTLTWQTLASVVVPGFTINRVVAASSFAVRKAVKNSPAVRRWAPTAIGLGVIPLIIHPIDNLVDLAMDNTVRKWTKDFEEDIGK